MITALRIVLALVLLIYGVPVCGLRMLIGYLVGRRSITGV
jgi:hypothetical protein